MIKKSTIYDFLTNIMVVFGIAVISICFFTFFFGKYAEGVSSIFALGEKGVPLSIIIQFLVVSCIITIFRWIFFTDKLIKTLSLTVRAILMFVVVIITLAIFAAMFNWFPVDVIEAWIMFYVCFAIATVISVIVTNIKEKKENQRLQEALEIMKQEEEV